MDRERMRMGLAIVEALQPAAVVKHDAMLRTAIDPAGRPVREAFAPILPPLVVPVVPGGGASFVARACRPALAVAYAVTPPSGGNATIVVSWRSATQGTTELVTIPITSGAQDGQSTAFTVPALPAGAWLTAAVPSASGASGISVAVSCEL